MSIPEPQWYTVYQYYTGCESFRVLATTPEEAIDILERDGTETDRVSARLSEEYLGIEHHVVHDEADRLVLTTAADGQATTALTFSFQIEARADGLYFQATHITCAAWHGPYGADEIGGPLAHYLLEDVEERIPSEATSPITSHRDDDRRDR